MSATLLEPSQGTGELSAHVLCFCRYGGSSSFFVCLERSLHAPFIVLRRCRVTECGRVV
jgi:hypothetical protein